MIIKELDTQLRAFIAGRRHDPFLDPITARASALEAQLQTAQARYVTAQQALDDATSLAERAYVKGDKVDTTARQRLRAAVAETEDIIGPLSNALAQAA